MAHLLPWQPHLGYVVDFKVLNFVLFLLPRCLPVNLLSNYLSLYLQRFWRSVDGFKQPQISGKKQQKDTSLSIMWKSRLNSLTSSKRWQVPRKSGNPVFWVLHTHTNLQNYSTHSQDRYNFVYLSLSLNFSVCCLPYSAILTSNLPENRIPDLHLQS